MIATLSLLVLLVGGQGTPGPFPLCEARAEGEGVGDGGQYASVPTPQRLNASTPALLTLNAQRLTLLSPQPSALSSQAQAAPEFVAGKGEWIQKPTTLKSLRGKVVLVDFWAYTCVNCIRTFPYVNQWYKRYHDKGFEVVAIHRPEFDFEGQPKNVAAAAKRFGFQFPVLNDLESKNWNNYGVDAWPAKFIVDANGKIVYRHEGEGNYDQIEKQIQAQLARANPKLTFNGTIPPVRPTDAPGAVCQPMTLEAFAASTSVSHFLGDQRGKKTHFTYPPKVMHGFYFAGDWTPSRMFVEEDGNAAFRFQYMAKEVNSVLRPSIGAVTAEVWQDGKPLPANAIGDDVKMVNGVATLKIDQPRMYSVIRNPQWGIHEIELRFKQPGARLYTLTFGTDCRPLPRRKR